MNAVEQRLAALEDEVKRLRKRVRASEQQDQLTLSAALLAQSLAGEERQVLKGYDGPIYDTNPDALTGFSTATDPYTIITSQVKDSTDEVYLVLKAVKPSGAITYESAISIGYDGTVTGGVGGSDAPFVKISPGADHVFYQELVDFHLASVLHVPDMSSDPTSASGVSPNDGWLLYRTDTDRLRLRANGAWVDLIDSGNASWTDLTDGGDTTLHSHALTSAYTQVYHKDNNGTSGRGPAATTSEVSLGSFTVTGGDMGTTGILRVRLIGHFVASGATSTVRIRVKFGGSTVYDDTSVTTAVNLPWFAEIHVANVGSASSQRIGGLIIIGANGATTGYGNLGTDEVNATTPIYATSSVNTASNQTFEVTAQLSNGTSPNAFTCYSLVAELL